MADQVSVRWGGSTVKISPEKVGEFLRSPEGPVLRRFIQYGYRVKDRTRASFKTGFPQDFLAPQVVQRIVAGSNGPHVIVGIDNTRTKPHVITGNPLLVFFWPKVGQTVYLRSVNHPGSNFEKYVVKKLTEALESLRGAL